MTSTPLPRTVDACLPPLEFPPLPLAARADGRMDPVDIEAWRRWRAEGCNLLPAVRVCLEASLPASWDGWSDSSVAGWLESAQGGRYSFFCDRPAQVILGWAEQALRLGADGIDAGASETWNGSPLEILAGVLASRRAPVLGGWPAMTGGLIGLFGYDLVRTWERLPWRAKRDLDLPLYAVIETAELYVFDHEQRTLGVVVWSAVDQDDARGEARFAEAEEEAAAAIERWQTRVRAADARPNRGAGPGDDPPAPSFTGEEFQQAVRRILGYIAAGDTYQVNLSRRESRRVTVAPELVYDALRTVNPSPYMGFFRLPAFALVCGSPELLVRLVNGVIVSRPIAGTRARGAGAGHDERLSAELLASEKERAEHLMLVDLIRNDIGRVAAFGSVRVTEFMTLERYSHVMHIVSEVEGRLAAGADWTAVFRAMFPGGTITGCPKVRTMEIIEELEPVGRGYYTGALGWISYAGNMELNIIIRSMLVREGVAQVQAGAGIVADSRPDRELDESCRKAQALWVALDRAQQRRDV